MVGTDVMLFLFFIEEIGGLLGTLLGGGISVVVA